MVPRVEQRGGAMLEQAGEVGGHQNSAIKFGGALGLPWWSRG